MTMYAAIFFTCIFCLWNIFLPFISSNSEKKCFGSLFNMTELFRDTTVGHLLRIISRQKLLPYEEDRNPAIWKRYIDKEKSGNMAHHGKVDPEEKDEEKLAANATNDGSLGTNASQQAEQGQLIGDEKRRLTSNRNSSDTRMDNRDDAQYNEVSGVRVDPEKGRDLSIVTWYSDSDPEVSHPNMLSFDSF